MGKLNKLHWKMKEENEREHRVKDVAAGRMKVGRRMTDLRRCRSGSC